MKTTTSISQKKGKTVGLPENENNLVSILHPYVTVDIMKKCNSDDIGEDSDDCLPHLIPDNQNEFYIAFKHRSVQIVEDIFDDLLERYGVKCHDLTTENLYTDILMNVDVRNTT